MSLAVLVLMASWQGCYCRSCDCTPALSKSGDADPSGDTGDSEDTGDEAPVDTGPPPPCDYPETEPNDTVGSAEAIEMEGWACGRLEQEGDQEYFRFTAPEAGWMKVWLRGADIGSDADLWLELSDLAQDTSAVGIRSPGSSDPLLVVPVGSDTTWFAHIADQFAGSGEHHEWEMLATLTKAPVTWTLEENADLDNDAIGTGQQLQSGDRVFGSLETGLDQDWYRIAIPDGDTDVRLHIEAWNYGSPADIVLKLYRPDQTRKKTANNGENSSDWDPLLVTSVNTEGEWYIFVDAEDDLGGELYWYVLDVETVNTPPVPDTGAPVVE